MPTSGKLRNTNWSLSAAKDFSAPRHVQAAQTQLRPFLTSQLSNLITVIETLLTL